MAVVKARESDIALLARLMRAEAEGEGTLGCCSLGMSALIASGPIVQIL